MKNLLFVLFTGGVLLQQHVFAGSIEQYVNSVEQINEVYKNESRAFFSSLNPQQNGFSQVQQEQFCAIQSRYVNSLYAAADENRSFLDKQYSNISKRDVIQQVSSSKEMQILKKYNVTCDLK